MDNIISLKWKKMEIIVGTLFLCCLYTKCVNTIAFDLRKIHRNCAPISVLQFMKKCDGTDNEKKNTFKFHSFVTNESR